MAHMCLFERDATNERSTMRTRRDQFEAIAREHLFIETLETRNRDSLDFHDVSVAGVSSALDAAYRLGQSELLAAAEALLEAKDNDMETIRERRALRRAVKHARKKA